jgi:gliding motility-associated-like protein
MSDKLYNKFKDFEQEPPKDAWGNIQSQLTKPKFNWLVYSTITGAVLLLVGIGVLVFSPSKYNIKNSPKVTKQITSNNSNNPSYSISQTNETKGNNLVKSNNSSHSEIGTNNNAIEVKEVEVSKNNMQLKAPDISTKNIVNKVNVNPTPALSSPKTQEPSSVQNNIVQSKKISIEDTIPTTRLFIPNAFTPTQNTNNVFKPAYTDLISFEMLIFNRLGVNIFSSKDINKGWDGYHKGRLCDQGVYVYIIKFKNSTGENIQKGTVTLIR